MTTKHTSISWEVDTTTVPSESCETLENLNNWVAVSLVEDRDEGGDIAEDSPYGVIAYAHKDHASLIAAAPEMLKALEAVSDLIGGDDWSQRRIENVGEIVETAIAKAKPLKPCPFCGTSEHLFVENKEERNPDYKSDFVFCGMCEATHLKDDSLGWNHRPIEEALQAEIGRLKDALDNIKFLTVASINGKSIWSEFIQTEAIKEMGRIIKQALEANELEAKA